jgi:hypothetical protein
MAPHRVQTGPMVGRPSASSGVMFTATSLTLIARALAQEPQFLVMDEPSSNLDYGNQIRLLLLIGRLIERKNLGVVMSTHFPNHAFLCASRVGLMKDGRMLALGTADEVMTESSLEKLYGIPVEIVTNCQQAGCVKICTPKLAGQATTGTTVPAVRSPRRGTNGTASGRRARAPKTMLSVNSRHRSM